MDIADSKQRKAREAMEKRQARELAAAERKKKKEAEKAAQQVEREALQQQCRSAMKPPSEFSEWGVIKTRAWRRCMRPIVRYAKAAKPGIGAMQKALAKLNSMLKVQDMRIMASIANGEADGR